MDGADSMSGKRYFLGNSVEIRRVKKWKMLLFAFVYLFVTVQLFNNRSSYAASWDSVDFALALERFDLFMMQPHFPGYPYFILGGMVLHYFIADPVEALVTFNVIVTVLSTIPIYFLARKWLTVESSIMVTLFVYTNSYFMVLADQPMSEAAAIGMLWWYIWSLFVARTDKRFAVKLVPLFLFSIVIGIRLSYLPFGIGLVLMLIEDWHMMKQKPKQKKLLRTSFFVLFAILFQLIWVVGLMLTEGDPVTFMKLAYGFVEGHFQDWGGAATSTSMPVFERFLWLGIHHFIWTGLAGQSVIVLTGYGVILLIGLVKASQRHLEVMEKREWLYFICLISAYFVWTLFAQNIEKPRHIVPAAVVVAFLFAVWSVIKGNKVAVQLVLGLVIFFQALHGVSLIHTQAAERPAVIQLTDTLQDIKEPFIVFTWEEMRVMDYLNASYPYKRIMTYDYFIQEIAHHDGKRIYLTNHVVEGFKEQGNDVQDHLVKVAEFSSSPLFDPIYYHIVLYEWKK